MQYAHTVNNTTSLYNCTHIHIQYTQCAVTVCKKLRQMHTITNYHKLYTKPHYKHTRQTVTHTQGHTPRQHKIAQAVWEMNNLNNTLNFSPFLSLLPRLPSLPPLTCSNMISVRLMASPSGAWRHSAQTLEGTPGLLQRGCICREKEREKQPLLPRANL